MAVNCSGFGAGGRTGWGLPDSAGSPHPVLCAHHPPEAEEDEALADDAAVDEAPDVVPAVPLAPDVGATADAVVPEPELDGTGSHALGLAEISAGTMPLTR